MSRRSGATTTRNQKAERAPTEPAETPVLRGWQKILLLLVAIVLLSFAFAPAKQFYLAWVGLVPWMIVIRHTRSAWRAFLWSWLFGCAFFTANMWWLAYVTGPGMAALIAVLGLYWAAAGAIIRATRLLEPGQFRVRKTPQPDQTAKSLCPGMATISILLIAAVWTGLEWFRGYWPLGGLAWAYLGHSQTPVIYLCQIADFSGAFGITFWVVMVNALVALMILHRGQIRPLLPAAMVAAAILLAVLGYGIFRVSQTKTRPGPTVMVVQPNYPQDNSGNKGADPVEIVRFHLRHTEDALEKHPNVNMVVWSETMMPALNPEALREASKIPSDYWEYEAALIAETLRETTTVAGQYHTAVLTGGVYYNNFKTVVRPGGKSSTVPQDRRNAAFLITAAGLSPVRYDKIHLVPFGEFLPFKDALPPLYKLFLALSPYTEEYTLTAGAPDALTVFALKPDQRFVTPICFEDLDGELMRRMFNDPTGHGKRADFIVNITNDGWFRYNEMPQHLQAAVLRSIENRAPTARSVNTGISGFIDSVGRTSDLIPAGTIGTRTATLALDSRVTFYTRWGDVFAYFCLAITVLLAAVGLVRWGMGRRRQSKDTT